MDGISPMRLSSIPMAGVNEKLTAIIQREPSECRSSCLQFLHSQKCRSRDHFRAKKRIGKRQPLANRCRAHQGKRWQLYWSICCFSMKSFKAAKPQQKETMSIGVTQYRYLKFCPFSIRSNHTFAQSRLCREDWIAKFSYI